MRQTLRRTASGVLFLLATSAVALPVASPRNDAPPRVAFQTASYPAEAPSFVATPTTVPEFTRLGINAPGSMLIARIDANEADARLVADESFAAASAPAERHFGVDLPRPGRGSAVLATLALVAVFFMRRIV